VARRCGLTLSDAQTSARERSSTLARRTLMSGPLLCDGPRMMKKGVVSVR